MARREARIPRHRSAACSRRPRRSRGTGGSRCSPPGDPDARGSRPGSRRGPRRTASGSTSWEPTVSTSPIESSLAPHMADHRLRGNPLGRDLVVRASCRMDVGVAGVPAPLGGIYPSLQRNGDVRLVGADGDGLDTAEVFRPAGAFGVKYEEGVWKPHRLAVAPVHLRLEEHVGGQPHRLRGVDPPLRILYRERGDAAPRAVGIADAERNRARRKAVEVEILLLVGPIPPPVSEEGLQRQARAARAGNPG